MIYASLVLRMGVIRDRTKRTVAITEENCPKSLLEWYGMASSNLTYTPDAGIDLPLDQPEKILLNKEDTHCFQTLTGSVRYLGQVTRYGIPYIVSQLARTTFEPPKAHMAAAKHLLRDVAETTDSVITNKRYHVNS